MEPVITSSQNPTIRHLKKLMTSSKARKEENAFVAEGIHLVRSFLDSDGTPQLYACATSALKNDEVQALLMTLSGRSIEGIVIADSLFESIFGVHASVGIAIIFSPNTPLGDDSTLSQSAILLDSIQDPGNMGTVLRTAAAVGVKTVFLSHGCSSPWSPKTLRAGMGAQFDLRIYENADLLAICRSSTIPVLATTLATDSVNLYELDLLQPVAWLFGSEGQGVSEALAASATKRVSIPQVHGPVESLNVAAAAAVCLYEQYRQNNL